ncbi:MAG: carbamoyl-phosphate synthase large subunit [Actinomycetia bacterium]|nr:carbamoyl-phosphate synthase large subunit [Actinomycetes bacterium]
MSISSVFIANRGEIAVRIARSAADLGLRTVAVYSTDDAGSRHRRVADEAIALDGTGARPYLDAETMVRLAIGYGCDALHPGYGFLSENADLARRCEAAGLAFIGPAPASLELFGDKTAARQAAAAADVPVLPGTPTEVDPNEARAFVAAHGPSMLKAVAGGGGRGLRVVRSVDEVADAYDRCRSEAEAGFGNSAVFVEKLVDRPRHVEVQILGDGRGQAVHLGDRDCSIQRRHQKIIEIAPAPGLAPDVRTSLHDAAVRLASSVSYRNAGTFEFLVDGSDIWFIEANARLQVEHTITEEITGIDLVAAQLRLADGASLDDLGLAAPPATTGMAVQARVNMETMHADGSVLPTGGTLTAADWPGGRGVRVDTFATAGLQTSPRFDSLLAKVIVWRHTDGLAPLAAAAGRAISETHVGGVATNLGFLARVLAHPDFRAGDLHTGFVDEHLAELVPGDGPEEPKGGIAGRAGAQIDHSDPLAVLDYGHGGRAEGADSAGVSTAPPNGTIAVTSPLQGTVVELAVNTGDTVRPGQVVVIMEAMKMEHEISTPTGGVVHRVDAQPGQTFFPDHPLLFIEPGEVTDNARDTHTEIDLDHIRDDLSYIIERHELVLDENRPRAVARRHDAGKRTARENVADLVDDDTFVEYGPMVVAAQKRRRSMEDLLVRSPADGLVTGVGSVNGDRFGAPDNRCAVMAYDYTVFAGTQGIKNHAKTDRILQVAREALMPLILFAEGGGGRPGDTDGGDFGTWTFTQFAGLSGLVPMVGITTGFCFAGNASLLGCCDVVIATRGSNIGMGGPAMVEGGGLGVFAPEEIGPMDVQVPNGVVDIEVADEIEAVAVAKQYLSYFQGPIGTWEEPDQRRMRSIIPENRLRVYEVRDVIDTLADKDSVLELRRGFGPGMVTALVRIEGRPMGVVANDPRHLGGAIDSDGSDKGARFMQLCDAYDIPLLFLCDTPGIMVGPEVERSALVRKSSRMFVIGANLTVPCFTILLRKAYGLGCIAMAGASFRNPMATVAWPTGEFGPMGLEGSVKLGFRDELATIEDPTERQARYDQLVEAEYTRGKADRQATGFAIDDAIDPADSRRWLTNLVAGIRPDARVADPRKKRAFIDAW